METTKIRFRTSDALMAYREVTEWDDGYLVVLAEYRELGRVEDYIDLKPILENLYINPEQFLRRLKNVVIKYD